MFSFISPVILCAGAVAFHFDKTGRLNAYIEAPEFNACLLIINKRPEGANLCIQGLTPEGSPLSVVVGGYYEQA